MVEAGRSPTMETAIFSQGCSMMARCLVGPGAAVVNCGLVSCSADGSSFSNGMAIAVGPETCGRELACYATMSLAEASAAAVDRTSPEAVKAQKAAVDDFAELARSVTRASLSSGDPFILTRGLSFHVAAAGRGLLYPLHLVRDLPDSDVQSGRDLL